MISFIKYLEWDSNFFDLPVFKIDYTSSIALEKAFSTNGDETVLYYVFSEKANISKNVLDIYNGKLVDEKVVLKKQALTLKNDFINTVELYNEKTPNDDLYRLAKISGKHSRYKIDQRLPSYTFEKMYNLWIENSCKNENCIIYICKHINKIVGFITLETSSNLGKVVLIAVDDSMQGKGIGYELMRKAENHFIELGIDSISVATQKNNKNGLNFYLRLGYEVATISKIYHFIFKKKNNENSF